MLHMILWCLCILYRGYTENQYTALSTGVLLNPVFWIWIPFISSVPILLLIAIIALITSWCCGFGCCCWPFFRLSNPTYFKDKYVLAPWYYPYYLSLALFTLNITTIIELSRQYFIYDRNIVYECYLVNDDFEDSSMSFLCALCD